MKRVQFLRRAFIAALILCLSACSLLENEENAAVEAEALALVRTIQSESAAAPKAALSDPAPVEIPTASPIQLSEAPVEIPTQLPTRMPTEIPTQPPTLVPTEFPTQPPAPIPTEIENELPTQLPDPFAEPGPAKTDDFPLFEARVIDPNASGRDWRELPIVPTELSDAVREIYAFGRTHSGRNPRFFSKIGDCQSFPVVFLGEYDPLYITTELQQEHPELSDAIFYFEGYNETSYSVFNGMSAASALTTTWSDPNACQAGESAIHCELRIHKPAFVFVNMGTNWNVGQDTEIFAEYLEEIVVEIISTGAIPILSSKTDNIEGDWSLNEIIARTAKKYAVPFFNGWRTIQGLPNHGLDPERKNIYMTTEAWSYRSLGAMQTLNFIGKSLGAY